MKVEGQVRIPSGCAIAAVISKEGKRMSGDIIYNAMKPMHDRSNGLGGGFSGYGIYPEYKDFYALHLFYDSRATRKKCEEFLKDRFEIVKSERFPHGPSLKSKMSRLFGDTLLLHLNPYFARCNLMKKNSSLERS